MGTWSLWASASERAVPVILNAAVRGVALLALAGIATAAMRRASAAARHLVWLLAMTGLLILPALAIALPAWRALPSSWNKPTSPQTFIIVAPPADVLPTASNAAANTNALPLAASDTSIETPAARTESTSAPETSRLTASERTIVSATRIEKPPLLAPGVPAPASEPLPWQFWLAVAWLLGAMFILAYVLLGFASLRLLRRQCRPLSADGWAALRDELSSELNLRQVVILLSSPRRAMPMTWGIFRTYILLPDQAAQWSPEQRRAVLLHELAHARRRDALTQVLAQAACAAYWFNPLVWVAWHRMQVERERACDDLALLAGTRASSYAQHLLQTAAALPAPRFVVAAVAMARPSTLEERLRAILDPARNRAGLSRRWSLAILLLSLAALWPVAALQAQNAPTPLAAAVPGGASSAITLTPPAQGGAATPVEGATCALDATIYDVRIPLEKLSLIDADVLNKAAADAGTFEKALANLGTAAPLYRATQSVRLAGDTISINTQTPYITNSQITPDGKTINGVSYKNTGAAFKLAGKKDGPGAMKVDLTVDVDALSDSGTMITSNLAAEIFRTATLVHKGDVKARQPFVLISVDAASRDQGGNAVAYIARVTLGAPQEN